MAGKGSTDQRLTSQFESNPGAICLYQQGMGYDNALEETFSANDPIAIRVERSPSLTSWARFTPWPVSRIWRREICAQFRRT